MHRHMPPTAPTPHNATPTPYHAAPRPQHTRPRRAVAGGHAAEDAPPTTFADAAPHAAQGYYSTQPYSQQYGAPLSQNDERSGLSLSQDSSHAGYSFSAHSQDDSGRYGHYDTGHMAYDYGAQASQPGAVDKSSTAIAKRTKCDTREQIISSRQNGLS